MKRNTNKVKFTVVFVLIALLLVGMCATVVTLDKQIETETVNVWAFKNGELNEAGKYVESDSALYLEEMLSVDGLEIEIVEDADITYKIYFYDADKKYLSASAELSENYTYSTVENAEYFRVVITPVGDEEISLFEKNGYAKQLTITVDRA